jgi:hypothetical protein
MESKPSRSERWISFKVDREEETMRSKTVALSIIYLLAATPSRSYVSTLDSTESDFGELSAERKVGGMSFQG